MEINLEMISVSLNGVEMCFEEILSGAAARTGNLKKR